MNPEIYLAGLERQDLGWKPFARCWSESCQIMAVLRPKTRQLSAMDGMKEDYFALVIQGHRSTFSLFGDVC